MYKSTKTYGHDLGLSAVFRQWRAKSHCSKLHGYALSFRFEFACDSLDQNGWVVDFGSLKGLKRALQATFDHTLVAARDDPSLATFRALDGAGLARLIQLERVGCEAFARLAYSYAETEIMMMPEWEGRGLRVLSVECAEHGANSAIYEGEQ